MRGLTCVRERERAYICEGEMGLTCVREREEAYLCEGERGGLPV